MGCLSAVCEEAEMTMLSERDSGRVASGGCSDRGKVGATNQAPDVPRSESMGEGDYRGWGLAKTTLSDSGRLWDIREGFVLYCRDAA